MGANTAAASRVIAAAVQDANQYYCDWIAVNALPGVVVVAACGPHVCPAVIKLYITHLHAQLQVDRAPQEFLYLLPRCSAQLVDGAPASTKQDWGLALALDQDQRPG
jgi:hypothetical protein